MKNRPSTADWSLAVARVLSVWVVSVALVIASPWPVRPERVGEPFEPPPKNAPRLELPEGSSNLAAGKSVTSGSEMIVIGRLNMITDGDKGLRETKNGTYMADEGHYVEIGSGRQFMDIDLEEDSVIDAIWIWHRSLCEGFEVPCDVVIQLAQDAAFSTPITTVFNCDTDNTLGLGSGTDQRFATSRFGKLIDVRGVPGKYLRIWSRGGARTELTQLVEVEVYGRPATLVRTQRVDRVREQIRDCNRRWILTVSGLAGVGLAFGLGVLIATKKIFRSSGE